jgi:hypothetical protein
MPDTPLPPPPPFLYDLEPVCTDDDAEGIVMYCSDFFEEITATACPAAPSDGSFFTSFQCPGGMMTCSWHLLR